MKNIKIKKKRMSEPGIEPGSTEWQSAIIPLNHSDIRL